MSAPRETASERRLNAGFPGIFWVPKGRLELPTPRL